jgi:hypothetical protein
MVFEYIRTESGEFQCPHCEYVKKNQSTVHMHIRAKHSGTYKHKCSTCDYETTTKQNLEKHMASKHPEKSTPIAKEFKCELCTFETKTKAGLRSHIMLKHFTDELNTMLNNDDNIQCNVCNEEFKSKPAFVYHTPKCLNKELLEKLPNSIQEILGV